MNVGIPVDGPTQICKRLGMFIWVLLLVNLTALTAFPQEDENDDLDSGLGFYLHTYVINAVNIPRDCRDFREFVIETLPWQDMNDPGVDSANRTRVRGHVLLTNGKILVFETAFITKNSNGRYELFYFKTKTVDQIQFLFSGRFLKKWTEDRPMGFSSLRGKLVEYKKDTAICDRSLGFTFYANE
jgi:hypothetical protein